MDYITEIESQINVLKKLQETAKADYTVVFQTSKEIMYWCRELNAMKK